MDTHTKVLIFCNWVGFVLDKDCEFVCICCYIVELKWMDGWIDMYCLRANVSEF